MSKRVPLYIQIKNYILDQIQEGIWKANEKIPSENELADQFKVSRITVKNALKELIDDGIIYRIQGKGTFITSDVMGEPMIYQSGPNGHGGKLVACIMRSTSNSQVFRFIDAMESALENHGYRMILCRSMDSQEKEMKLIREMLALGVKGILICPVEGKAYNREILRLSMSGFPIVLIDRYLRGIETNSVCADNIEGARMAVNHLIELGHTRIGFISTQPKDTSSIEDRLTGYEKALSENNIPIDHRLRLTDIQVDGKQDIGRQIITNFIQDNGDITAFLTSTAALGVKVVQIAEILGKNVPQDFSIITFDNYEFSRFSRVPLTYIDQQESKIGHTAVELLVSTIDKIQKPQQIFIPTQLIERKSTAMPPSS